MADVQWKVLDLVKMIPKGKVTTYLELAKAAGIPKGWRIVAMILSKNPTPVVIPCHRVVRSDGSLGGYIFGIRKKAELLASEGIPVKNG
ncbi:MAG: MGMT family protein, partial [Candidatus Hadarchaeales archaeon]